MVLHLKAAKRRISEESEAPSSQQPKQPRTAFTHAATPAQGISDVYTSSSQTPSANPLPSLSQAMPPNRGQAKTFDQSSQRSLLAGKVTNTASSKSSMAGSSMENPIDLTETRRRSQELQILEDERVARALQDDLDAGRIEADPDRDADYDGEAGPDPMGEFATFDATQAFSSPDQLRIFGRWLGHRPCSKCGYDMTLDGLSITTHMRDMVASQEGPHPYMRCARCRMFFCVGSECKQYHHGLDSLLSDKSKVPYCCDMGRLFLVFSLLCGPEYTHLAGADQPATPANTSIAGRLRTRLRSKSDQGDGAPGPSSVAAAGKSPQLSNGAKIASKSPGRTSTSKLSRGTGYGGEQSLIQRKIPDRLQYLPRKGLKLGISDDLLERYFRYLAVLLPDPNRQNRNGFDLARQQIIGAMIPRSPLVQSALELLRDESMEDMTAKLQLYDALVSLLETVYGHPDTKVTLFIDHARYQLEQQLVHIAFEGGHPLKPVETTHSVNSALRKLASYCRYYLRKAAGHEEDFSEPESESALRLAQRICSASEAQEGDRQHFEMVRIRHQGRPSPAKGGGSLATSSVTTRSRSIRNAEANKERILQQAAAWHQDHRVEEIPDDEFIGSFYFAKKAKALETATLARGRMKKLITQLASLRQDLPDGIYLRHASSRVDLMKVLFVGPSDTPYENGLFEFDFLCGADFPAEPPEVQFRTTGSGRVSFNPNLYHNGKVCLSLLGTWTGQPWIPGESTIEQILVSIQAMIFTENPWYNEPGRETHLNDMQCQSYNRQIQQSTVRHAMTYWLEARLGQPTKAPKVDMLAEAKAKKRPLGPASKPVTPTKPSAALYGPVVNPTATPPKQSGPLYGPFAAAPNSPVHPNFFKYLPQMPPAIPKPSPPQSVPLPELTPNHMFNNLIPGPNNQGVVDVDVEPMPVKYDLPPGFAPGHVYHLSDGAESHSHGHGHGHSHGHGPGNLNAGPPPQGFAPGQGYQPYQLVANPLAMQPPSASASNLTSGPPVYMFTPMTSAWKNKPPSAVPSVMGHQFPFADMGPLALEDPFEPVVPPTPPAPSANVPSPSPLPAHPPQVLNPLLQGFPAGMLIDLMDSEGFMMTHANTIPMPMMAGSDSKPIGNTVVDSNDDNVWGDVIRHHFSTRGHIILESAKKWSTHWWNNNGERDIPLVKDLEAALEAHGFI